MSTIAIPRSREYLSLGAAAERLGVSPKTLRRRIAEGKLRAFRTGTRLIRIRAEDLDELFEEITTLGSIDTSRRAG